MGSRAAHRWPLLGDHRTHAPRAQCLPGGAFLLSPRRAGGPQSLASWCPACLLLGRRPPRNRPARSAGLGAFPGLAIVFGATVAGVGRCGNRQLCIGSRGAGTCADPSGFEFWPTSPLWREKKATVPEEIGPARPSITVCLPPHLLPRLLSFLHPVGALHRRRGLASACFEIATTANYTWVLGRREGQIALGC